MISLPRSINRKIGRAMHDYSMLAHGDRVLLAVSGGVDSLVLSWILDNWRHKAPINYEIKAVHIDMGFGGREDYKAVSAEMDKLNIPLLVEHSDFGINNQDNEVTCYRCARRRRGRLFELAREYDCQGLALGHHMDDIIETLFINMLYSGNISTMRPGQELFNGRLTLIRPLAYLAKDEVWTLARLAGITPVKNPCPRADHNKRDEVRNLLKSLYQRDPLYRANIFASLHNVKTDYLL